MSNPISADEALERMSEGDVDTVGLMPWGSNYTFLVKVVPKGKPKRSGANNKNKANEDKDKDEDENVEIAIDDVDVGEDGLLAVYKPRKGETPLWDFPDGTLCLREWAAYLVSRDLGWHIIPPTILRNGDHGVGSVQLFIDNDPNQHFFTFRDDPNVMDDLRKIAIFDLIANNADRKSGHCLRDKTGKVWAIDHGITFNSDYKLRTVIWDFAGEPIPDELLSNLQDLRTALSAKAGLSKTLCQLLDEAEMRAFLKRLDGLLKIKTFPSPNRYERSVPWPPV